MKIKTKFKKMSITNKIVSIVLASLLIFGLVFATIAISSKLKDETKRIRPSFSVGGLDTNGKFVKTKESIVTKKSFACKGLEVKLDFDSKIKYQIFYYDENDNYITRTDVLNSTQDFVVPGSAVNARIVITPIWGEDVEEKDQVCRWYNTRKYSSQLKIRVLKDQDSRENLVAGLNLSDEGYKRTYSQTIDATMSAVSNYKTTKSPLSLVNITSLEIKVAAGGTCSYIFYDINGVSLMASECAVGSSTDATTATINVPTNAAYVHFNFSLENGCNMTDYQIYAA